ncbi:hypothetical protein JTE90_008408 [Oedothorax gibbosus]|uniref:Uncharacterized protein n=1 Tax=Oedothorax gibbosus TaxID=931172 RepID=A0AAV6V619_9ARAC|nr:hypothetical protein JTE90_008408 [Oedothorax gibbosus]
MYQSHHKLPNMQFYVTKIPSTLLLLKCRIFDICHQKLFTARELMEQNSALVQGRNISTTTRKINTRPKRKGSIRHYGWLEKTHGRYCTRVLQINNDPSPLKT